MAFYPWLEPTYQELVRVQGTGRLPHALLLLGAKGLGKLELAQQFVKFLHCQQPQENQQPCNACEPCHLLGTGGHPDAVLVQPEEQGKPIKIAQIRALVEFSNHTAQLNGYRSIIINHADSMNWNAQNALLKTLEEPGQKTIIILVAEQASLLLPTIISRCQQVKLPLPEEQQALQWLEDHGHDQEQAQGLLLAAAGAPLRAVELAQTDWFVARGNDLLSIARVPQQPKQLAAIAKQFSKYDMLAFLAAFYQWLALAIKQQYGVSANKDAALVEGLNLLQKLPQQRLFQCQRAVTRTIRLIQSGANPNKEMLFEQLLMVLLGVPIARDTTQAY